MRASPRSSRRGAWALWPCEGRLATGAVVAGGLALRLPFVLASPALSADAYRYRWDGLLLLAGGDPLSVAPNAVPAAFGHAALLQHIDYAGIPSLYPPVAYALFTAGALLGGGVSGEKLVMLIGDLVTLGAIAFVLRARGMPSGRLALYAWSPLVVCEVAWSGHLEGWLAAALVVTVAALDAGRSVAGGFAFALAVLVKLHPLDLLPAAFGRRFRPALLALGTIGVAYGLERLRTPHVFGSVGSYLAAQRFNDVAYDHLGSLACAALLGLAVLSAAVARDRGAPLVACLLGVEIVTVLVSPNVLPWYVVPIVALLGLEPALGRGGARFAFAGIAVWSLTIPLTYGVIFYDHTGSNADEITKASVLAAPLAGVLAAIAARLSYRSPARPR